MNVYVLGAIGLGAWWLLSRRRVVPREKPGAEKPITPPAPIISPVKVSSTITPPSQIPVRSDASPLIILQPMEASDVQQQSPNMPRWVSEIDVMEPMSPTSESGGIEIRTDGSKLTVTTTTEA